MNGFAVAERRKQGSKFEVAAKIRLRQLREAADGRVRQIPHPPRKTIRWAARNLHTWLPCEAESRFEVGCIAGASDKGEVPPKPEN